MAVCTGCGLPLEAESFAPQLPLPAAGAPAGAILPAAPNPWRQPTDEPVTEVYVEAPALVEAAAEIAEIAEIAATVEPAKPKLAEGVPQDPPGMALKLTFADPLPPLPPPVTEPVVSTIGLSTEPAPQLSVAEAAVSEPGFVLEDEPLAVPAAYAQFASEPIAAEAVEAPAEVVPLVPAGGLRVAPSGPYIPDAATEAARASSANG
jgi:hypothetical protein